LENCRIYWFQIVIIVILVSKIIILLKMTKKNVILDINCFIKSSKCFFWVIHSYQDRSFPLFFWEYLLSHLVFETVIALTCPPSPFFRHICFSFGRFNDMHRWDCFWLNIKCKSIYRSLVCCTHCIKESNFLTETSIVPIFSV